MEINKILDICFRLTATLNDLNEERQLGKALRNNQQQWQAKLTRLEEKFNELKQTKEKEISDLKEQVRDLMFFIDAQRVSRFSLKNSCNFIIVFYCNSGVTLMLTSNIHYCNN